MKTHTHPFKCAQTDCIYHTSSQPQYHLVPSETRDTARIPLLPCMYSCRYNCLYAPCTYGSEIESNLQQHMEKKHGYNGDEDEISGEEQIRRRLGDILWDPLFRPRA
ncbi:hypothetical protein DFH27DRAFT_233075 [Peziza echinospora]|nr:hypothetical protein DFH27DRAFT_233075 [Peziza echinospora]